MALPTNLAAKIKSIPMDPTILAANPELAYILSFSNHTISHDSIHLYPRDSFQSPLEHFQFADFEDATYEQLQEDTFKNIKHKNKQVVKAIRCGFKEFYSRVASTTHNVAIKFMSRQRPQGQKKIILAKEEEEEYRIEKLKGNNPSKWPETTNDFLKDVNQLPWHAFSSDSELMFTDFVESVKTAMINLCHRGKILEGKLQETFRANLLLQIEALLSVVLRTNNQSFILEQLRFLCDLNKYTQLDIDSEKQICTKISTVFDNFFSKIPQEPSQKYHAPGGLWKCDPFVIMKKIHFQKQPGLTFYSITTDGDYLYIYISAINGSALKVGTGQNGTKAGKIYFEKQIHFPIGTKVEEVNWVYLKGKLYLKTSARDPWMLEVINPNNFSSEGYVQLFCPSLFGQQSLININKNCPLLTDGEKLYYLGNRIKICKSQDSPKKDEKPHKSQEKKQEEKKKDENKKAPKNKKAGKKLQGTQNPPPEQPTNHNYLKILQIVLYEFDVEGKKVYEDDGIDEKDIAQLYDSFSGYFSKQECRRALILNSYDLAETCQWLFNEGEKEKDRNIKVLDENNYVILAECQITSNFQERGIKGPNEIVVKEGSTLLINNLYESIWTMDNEHISCYSEQGLKVFSKDQKHSKRNLESKLSSTLMKTLETKIPRNPECRIIYDPSYHLFYTFVWPQDGHYFPTAVLIAKDKKHLLKLQQQKRLQNQIKPLTKLQDIQIHALQHMNYIDRLSLASKCRFNDWLWYYGQRIIEIGQEMNRQNSDKKRLSNKRTKILAKMNKINEVYNIYEKDKATLAKEHKVMKQIVKIYPFSSEGTVKSYHMISESFRNPSDHPEQMPLYVLCLENWLQNCSIISEPQIKLILVELGQQLLHLKESASKQHRQLINKLLVQEFYFFFPTHQKQINYITSMNSQQLNIFVKAQWKHERKEKESIIYELSKKEHIVQKYQTNKCEFSEVFKSSQNVNLNDVEQAELLGNLLLSEILKLEKEKIMVKDKYDEKQRKKFFSYVRQMLCQSQAGNKLVQFLFLASFKIIIQNHKDSELFAKYQNQLFLQVFKLYQKAIPKIKTNSLFHILPTLLMIIQVYHSSVVAFVPNQNIIDSLLKILESLQRPEFNEINNILEDYQYEGVSPTTEKIYETSHPLERGKNHNFPPKKFKNASLVVLDLDKRCQSDPNNDTLTIQTVHMDSPIGNNIQVNDGVFNSTIRLSGAVDTKKPILILGKAIVVDFNSSGHVKDAQSLVRYGFKFGVRPIFTGKIKFDQEKKDKITKIFQSLENFEYYFNTLKFTSIAISNTIQNYLSKEHQAQDPKLSELLKNKIFKEGYEDIACKPDSWQEKITITISKLMEDIHETIDKKILKMNQSPYWDFKPDQNTLENQSDSELWNFEGIPQYIRTYLQQIKDFKGDFIDVFIEARELAKEKGTYAQMMKRASVKEHKTLWLQGQAILFLTILKHSGLLHLNLKFSIQYIKQNLKAFEEARDGIYNSFISRIQYVNQWRHLIETYIGKDDMIEMEKKESSVTEQKKEKSQIKAISVKRKGGQVKTIKIGEKVQEKNVLKKEKSQDKPPQPKKMEKSKFQKEVRERLSHETLIKGVCNTRKIKYQEHNQFDTVTRIIDELIKAAQQPLQSEEKAYQDPIQHLIRCCLFLLKFKSPSTKQSLSENEHIVPVGMMRSLSEGNSRNCDSNKVNLFREWLQNWKNWKGFKKENHIQLQFPVEQIVKYINSWFNLKDISKAINQRYLKCENRIKFYSNYTQLLKLLSQNKIVKYILGSETLNIGSTFSSDLESISTSKIKELSQSYELFKNNIKNIEGTLINKLPISYQSLQNALDNGSDKFLLKLKLLLHTMFLLQSENPSVDLNTILYVFCFKYLSHHNENLVYISNAILQRGFVCKHSNEEIVTCLNREVGRNNISFKRWKQYFFIERVLFLLRKLEVNLRSKEILKAETQIQIAQSIFFIMYHVQIPLVARLGLKILKRLNISLKSGIKTPFDYEYKLYKSNDSKALQFSQSFHLSRNNKNNITLLCSKLNNIFDSSYSNELAKRFDGKVESQEDKYNIVLNLHQEEDLYWMLKVLYYIDELEVKKGEKVLPKIKDFDQYLNLKNKKKEGGEKKEQSNNNNNQNNNQNQKEKNPYKEEQKNERIFNNLPSYSQIDPELQVELPVGWYFNYCNIFADPPQNVPALQIKNQRHPHSGGGSNQPPNKPKNKNPNQNNQNPGKKNWNTPVFTKLAKKYEEFNSKPIEEPKQGDDASVKAEFVKTKNIFNRIRRYFVEIAIMADNFGKTGFFILREDISRSKMNQLCQLIISGSINRLKDVQIDLQNNDIKTKLSFNDFVPNFTSKLKITIIKNKDYPYFNNLVSYQSSLLTRGDHHQSNYYALLGKRQLALEDSKAFMPYEQFIPFDQSAEDDHDIELGKQWIESNFSRMKKKYEKVYLSDYPNDIFYLAQGGVESGIRDNVLLPSNDSSLTLQTAVLDKIMTQPKFKSEEPQYQETELPEELVEKIMAILDRGNIEINKKEDIKDYLLLTFYLKKLINFDLQFGDMSLYQEFAQKLFKYIENLHSFKELSVYKQESQKLIIKLIDNQHQKLHFFGTYINDDDYDGEIEEYRVPVKLEKLNSSNQVKQESIQTHASIKSKYLIKSQPPQIEQNKLLKYWEKNILPKIHEFVKTTLKPLQIEDFWEQMRRPLRVGDHTEAKRVAYIICDNKLPAGAILPDANHNWNSLELQQIFVGENVLVKIPKAKADFCTPLLGWGNHDHRLAKVVFVDVKSNSILVRYRLEELALFSYAWVPINALMAVEKEVMHISTKSIFEQLSTTLEGMIYIYSKECLTKLAAKVKEVDNIKLIKETILDMLIKNPISGCFSFPKPTWSMLPVFQKMLLDKNWTILDILEKEFCSIKGIDLNLNCQKMTELNRFDNGKALIVSFKKDARLAQCSGIRFYNDKYGYNEIAHVYTAKTEKSDIEPLEFNEPNIYCRYYTNKECLPILEQSNYKIYSVEATIFAVDDMWTIGCYIGQVVCQLASQTNSSQYIQILQKLNTIFLKWLAKKSVSILCSYLSKLISKIALTIKSLCQKHNKEVTLQILGTSIDQLKDIITWINKLLEEESKDKVALYSALLQNLSEMVATLLVKEALTIPNLPEHIKASLDLIKIFKEIDSFTKTKKMSLVLPNPPANYQWERILEISNIPSYISEDTIYKALKEIIHVNKGKILCPKLDIFQKDGKCYVLVDGWDINELVEEDVMEKMEHEIPEEREDEMNGASSIEWECPACTFMNPSDTNICQVCETPAPVAVKQEEVYDEVEATDLEGAERKLKEKEAKRFEEVKIQILKFFEDEYKATCTLVEKRNQEVENKDAKKHKKGGKQEQVQLKEIPKKPQIKIQTGSTVFEKPEIDGFLKQRFEYFPKDLQKQIQDSDSYIGKFKKLLNLGYDLWGDNISNQNATLIPFSHLYQLMDYVQTEICKGSSSVLSYSQDSIRILSQIPVLDSKFEDEPVNYTSENDMGVRVKYKVLAGFKSYNVRFSWKFVKKLNLAASKCLQLINMDFKYDKERNDTYPVYNDCLGYKIKYYRNLIMGVIKLQLFQKIIQRTSVSRQNDQVPKITLERLRIREERGKSKLITVKEKEDYLFTKSHDQFLKVSPAFLRPFKPKGTDPYLSFTVNFRGENVMGEAGPYRQFFTDIGRELDPHFGLGLFIPSPNNRNESSQHKSKWVINPKANSTYHFSLFEFIGTLMGCCFRTGSHIALDLPLMFWKSIAHEQITDDDLEEVDSQLTSFLKMLENCPSKEQFQQAMEYTNGGHLTWTFRTCDDEIHELIYNGKNINVEFDDIRKYIQMLKLKKINQAKLQIKRIVRGISELVPLPYLHCLTGQELKLIICGRPKVDVELLKKHTKYSGGLNQDSRRIKFFWEIMRELTEIDRLKIIRFCWGQERLPINSEQFQRNNIRFMIKPMVASNRNQDQSLPKADTCFFNIELPDYSSKALMKEKILLAVNLDSVSINADLVVPDDNPLMNELGAYEQDNYDEEDEEYGGGG